MRDLITEGHKLLEARPIKLPDQVVTMLVKRLMGQFVPALQSMARVQPTKPIGDKLWATEKITVSDVKGKKREIPVSVISVKRPGVRGLFLGAVYAPKERIINMMLNGNLGAGELVPLLRGTEMSSIQGAMKYALMHEITHAKDVLRKKSLERHIVALLQQENPVHPFSDRQISQILKAAGYGEVSHRLIARKRKELGIGDSTERLKMTLTKVGLHPPDSPKEQRAQAKAKAKERQARYYNSPEEVKAYMQEISAQVRDLVGAHRAKLVAWPQSKAVTFLLGQSNTWREIKKHLTPKSQNRIKKGVVTVLQDMGVV